jgi:imidazolonepropionase-like amidohydrolase
MGEISGISVWDGHTDLGASRLTWDDDNIVGVESTTDADGALAEYNIVPGLVDTHVHLGAYSGTRSVDWSTWPLITPAEERVFHIAANAQRAARFGVTTLRDLGGDATHLAVSRVFEEGIQVGPRIIVHGQVGMTAGHGDLFVPPHYPHRPPVADSPDECRKLVRQWARSGAHGVKIYTSGGVLSMGDRVGWRNQTNAEIATTIDEAHALGMLVAAHTHSTVGVDIALAEGVDSIEHGTGITPDHFDTLLERNLPIAPTLMINDAIADGRVNVPAEAREKAQEVVAQRNAGFTGAGAAGIRFVLGTDANGVMVKFGDQLEEVRLMRAMFGWTAERAMRAATSDAADAIGLGARVGTLAAGFGADFVVLRGHPARNIDDLHVDNIVAVVSRGRLVFGELPGGSAPR